MARSIESQFRMRLDEARSQQDDTDGRLREVGKVFQSLQDPSPRDVVEYRKEYLDLVAARARRRLGHKVEKPRVPRLRITHDQLRELRSEGRGLVEDLPAIFPKAVLEAAYPSLSCHWTLQTKGMGRGRKEGWYTFEDTSEALHARANVNDVKKIESKTGRSLMHVLRYYIASYDHFARTGQHFDQGATWALVRDPRATGAVLLAGMMRDGKPSVYAISADALSTRRGGARFEGVVKP